MSSSEDIFFGSTTNFESNVDITLEETVPANSLVQQPYQYQCFYDSLLIPHGQTAMVQRDQIPQDYMFQENNFENMSQGTLHVSRSAVNQQPQLNFAQSGNVFLEVGHPRGRMSSLFAESFSRIGNEVERNTCQDTQPKEDSPRFDRPIINGLYDPAYAEIGLPMDPHLRMLKWYPEFCIIPKPKKAKV